jgi:hypothetical protein
VRDRWGANAAELADRLLATLRRLPHSPDGPRERLARFRPRDLARLHRLGRQLLAALDHAQASALEREGGGAEPTADRR